MKNSTFPRMHVSLYVSNVQDTVNFYNQFFGQEADKIKTGYAKYILDNPALIISFVENPDRVNPNFGHLGFQVETLEQLKERLDQAKAYDIVHLEELGTACCYAVQDKFWSQDPDGHRWEVYYFHKDAEFNDPRYELADTEVCCMPTQEKKKVSIAEIGATCDPASNCC